jgi:hypothetical protein
MKVYTHNTFFSSTWDLSLEASLGLFVRVHKMALQRRPAVLVILRLDFLALL